MMVMAIRSQVHEDKDDGDQDKGIIIGFSFAGLKMSREVIDRV
jgi:hypothetical protein